MEESRINESEKALHELWDKKIKDFYLKYFSAIKNYIITNSGDLDDAKDIFQEVALVYFKLLNKPDHIKVENEKNYLLGIARNIWLKKIKEERKVSFENYNQLDQIEETASNISDHISHNNLLDLVLKKLDEISEECRKIIHSAFYLKLSAVEIAVSTGYSEKFIKVKKYRCLQGLKKIISTSAEYKNFQI